MADLPGDFWSGWIAVLTVVSLAGLAWLTWSIYFGSGPDHESPVWDENLREGLRPAPLWWFWLILALLVFSVIYLILYPGLGSYRGALAWSQHGRLEDSAERHAQAFAEVRDYLETATLKELQAFPVAMRTASGLFRRECAACHGADAGGQAQRFPNLRDKHWQWGGSPEQITQAIRGGRQAAMPPLGSALGETGLREVAAFVQNFSAAPADHPGRSRYQQQCAACHGQDGQGNPALGAPSFADDVWLYGGSIEAITESISAGRNGEMPAFEGRLDAVQIKLLTAWLTR